MKFAEVVASEVWCDIGLAGEVGTWADDVAGESSGIDACRDVGGEAVADHQRVFGFDAESRGGVLQESRVGLAELAQSDSSRQFNATGDGSAIDEPRGLVGGAEDIGMRRESGNAIVEVPGGAAETVVGEGFVKGNDDGVGCVVNDVVSIGLEFFLHGGDAEEEEAFPGGMFFVEGIDEEIGGCVEVLTRVG